MQGISQLSKDFRECMMQSGKSGQVQEGLKIYINLPQVSSLPDLIYHESKQSENVYERLRQSVRKVEGYNKCPRNQRTKRVLHK